MVPHGLDIQRLHLAEDARGFVRRACPACARHFKVGAQNGDESVIHAVFVVALDHANAEELPALPQRFCPYCGHAASADRFLTASQRQYVEACARTTAGMVRYEQLLEVERHLDENPYVTFIAVPPDEELPSLPPEPDDMQPAPLWCCGEELKLKSSWKQPFFCPQCRAKHGHAP